MRISKEKFHDITGQSVRVNLILLITLIIALVVSASLAYWLWNDTENHYVREELYQDALEDLEEAQEKARELKYKKLLDDARNKNRTHHDSLIIKPDTDDSTRAARERANLEFIYRLGLDKGLPE